MNILNLVSTTRVKTAKFEYDGKTEEVYYRDLTGAEGEILTEKMDGLLALMAKQKNNSDYTVTSNDLLDANLQRDSALQLQLCDEHGGVVFETVEAMRKIVPAKMLDIVSKAIARPTTGDAEKNLKSPNGSAGYSDSQTDKIPALIQSSETTQKVS